MYHAESFLNKKRQATKMFLNNLQVCMLDLVKIAVKYPDHASLNE
jgi:hypothetical protein